MITYRVGEVSGEEAREVYRDCTLGKRRPTEDDQRFTQMLRGANLIVSAWDDDRIVSVARSLTDRSYVTYVADLSMCDSYQKQGIGRELLRRTRMEVPQTQLVLFAASQAVDYYGKIGFTRHPSRWTLQPDQPL
jgi:GNAT superfamily N-acetyltransferase